MERVDKLLSSTTNYLSIIKCDTTDRTLPFKCAVYGCSNEFTDFESHQSATFKFHNFPTCERTRKQWLEACGLPEDTGTANAKICSDHFTLNDYSRKLREELLNPGYKRLLTDTAVPSVNFKPYSSLELNRLPTSPSEKLYQPPAKAPANRLKSTNGLNRTIFTLRREVLNLQKTNADSRTAIHHKKASLEASRKKLKKVAQELETILSPQIPEAFLSQAQINLLKGHKKVFWTDDDIAKAFTLRHRGGKELYLYLRHTLNYPLPALSCVQAWAGNI